MWWSWVYVARSFGAVMGQFGRDWKGFGKHFGSFTGFVGDHVENVGLIAEIMSNEKFNKTIMRYK
jgi:hypothetical protein